jgi:hypothetical protein
MTVCIAAKADMGKSLVLACDQWLSNTYVGGNVADKLFPLSNMYKWWALTAGHKIVHISTVIDAAIHSLLRISNPLDNTEEIVQRCVLEGYRFVRQRHATDLVLAPIGLTYDYFITNLASCPEEKQRIEEVDLCCTLLVAGFDFAGDAFIFTVENPGIVESYSYSGWWAIGDGSKHVMEPMLVNSVNWKMDLATVLYMVCVAKFRSEVEPTVGKDSNIKVEVSTGKMNPKELPREQIDNIRNVHNQYGDHPPSEFIEYLRRYLASQLYV